jgi:peptidoglycan hydrolase-like protein with peptidoglycan-binding domain
MQTACSGFLSAPGWKAENAVAAPPLGVKNIQMPSLRPGAKGGEVAVLQQALIRKHFEIKADGQFGAVTEAAVKAFQTQAGLVADGVAGLATKKALGLA